MIDYFGFYLLVIPVVLLGGMSKGGFGGGLGTLAVPVLSLLIDPRLAAAVLLPILCTMDLVSIWNFRGTWDKHNIKLMLPGAMLGITAGALTFQYMNANMIRLMVGVLALYFVGHYLWGVHVVKQVRGKNASLAGGSFWGTISGYVSYIAHAGGPPISIYLLPQKLPKTTFVGTTVLFFTIVNYVKLVPYAWFGQLNLDTLLTSLILLPLAPVGVRLGVYLHHRVSDKWFYWICYGLLFVAGIKLLVEGGGNVFF